MDLNYTPEQVRFREDVRQFIADRLPREIREHMRAGYLPHKEHIVTWQRVLNERGWATPNWPREYGGAGLGEIERLILMDELGRASAPLPSVFNVTLLGPVLIEFGTPEQKAHWLPKLANADVWFCQGFSEPNSGSDLASLRTRAERTGDRYVVNGQKTWTSLAHVADWIFCLVRTSTEARKQDGISFLLIDLRSKGITIRPIISIDGDHHLNEVFFDNVEVPVANLVGTERRGWACARFLLGNERALVANVGLIRERLDHACEGLDLIERKNPRRSFAGLRRESVAIDAELRLLEVLRYRVATADSTVPDGGRAPSVLKLKGVELLQRSLALGQKVGGGEGLLRRSETDAYSTEPAAAATSRYMYSRAASIYGGSNEIQKEIISRAVMG